MNRKLLYIINPISGTRSKKILQQLVERITKEANIPFLIYPSVADGNYQHLAALIKKENITDVIIAGGDGTVNQVVASLQNEKVNFGIIPRGSGNGLALAARIPRNAANALKVIFTGKASFIDAFTINNRFACMLAGMGFDARVAHDFMYVPKRGLVTYIKLCFKNFFAMKPHRFEIKAGNARLEVEAFFISIANSNQFGNYFTIAPKASLSDGLLDVVIVTGMHKISFMFKVLLQLTGLNKMIKQEALEESASLIQKRKGIIYFQTPELEIINHTRAPLHLDGEPAETHEKIVAKVKQTCFRLIQPA
jgi:YegS/Rv2252/BmrU family lipid kinase